MKDILVVSERFPIYRLTVSQAPSISADNSRLCRYVNANSSGETGNRMFSDKVANDLVEFLWQIYLRAQEKDILIDFASFWPDPKCGKTATRRRLCSRRK